MTTEVFKKRGNEYVTIITEFDGGEQAAKTLAEALKATGADATASPIIGGDMTGYTVTIPARDINMVKAAGWTAKDDTLPTSKREFAPVAHVDLAAKHPNQGRDVF